MDLFSWSLRSSWSPGCRDSCLTSQPLAGRQTCGAFPDGFRDKVSRFTRTAGLPFPVFNALCIQAEKISLSWNGRGPGCGRESWCWNKAAAQGLLRNIRAPAAPCCACALPSPRALERRRPLGWAVSHLGRSCSYCLSRVPKAAGQVHTLLSLFELDTLRVSWCLSSRKLLWSPQFQMSQGGPRAARIWGPKEQKEVLAIPPAAGKNSLSILTSPSCWRALNRVNDNWRLTS